MGTYVFVLYFRRESRRATGQWEKKKHTRQLPGCPGTGLQIRRILFGEQEDIDVARHLAKLAVSEHFLLSAYPDGRNAYQERRRLLRQCAYVFPSAETKRQEVEEAFKTLTERQDIGIILINQHVGTPVGRVPDTAAACRQPDC